MARRTVKRRSNPRGGSMLLVNPRRRRTTTRKRKSNTGRKTRRKNVLVVRRANPKRRRSTSRRRTTTRRRRSNTRRRATSRRANPRRRRATSRRRRTTKRRSNSRRRSAAPRAVYRRRSNGRKGRKKNGRKRNPGSGIEGFLKRIPLVGGLLANIFGFAPHALFGALSVEPTMWAAKFLAPFVPMVPASLFYPVVGLLVAAIIKAVPFGSAALRDKLAVAVAAASGGVGYYKARTGMDAEMGAEAGMLELRGVGNLGSILQIRPYAGALPNYGQAAPYGYAYNQHVYRDGMAYQVRPF